MTKVKHITRIAYKVPPTGFSTFDVEYYLSTSTTTLAGGSWQTTPPAWIEGRYMWSRTKVVMTDGTTTYSDPVCIGGTGRGIQSIQEQYYLSTSNTTQTGGSWANSPQTWVDGKYMWTRSVITYTDGSTVTTDPVCVTGGKGEKGQASFKSIVFKRSNSTPSTPAGGSYASPVPSGWSDGVPSGDAQLWMSTRIFTSDGESPQQSAWTTPQAATDTADIDFEYSSYEAPGTPETQPSRWHNSAASGDIWMAVRKCKNGTWGSWEVFKIKGETGGPGDPGPEGKSFAPVYKNSDTKPATPTGTTFPPTGWRGNAGNVISGLAVIDYDPNDIPVAEQLQDGSGNLVVGTQNCLPIDFTLGTEEVEYGVPYYVLPGYEIDGDEIDHIDYGCAIARIDVTTSNVNQQLRIELLASSEATYDCIMVGKLDSPRIPDRTVASSYSGKASGNNIREVVDISIPTVGAHFIYVVYRKDSSASKFSDRGCFRVADLSETLWMSIATMQGNTVQSWSDPIKMTAGRGERGSIPRMRAFAEGVLFMEGKAGEAYLDFAVFNNRYYRCTKTHVAQVGETPYAAVQAGSGLWALENDYQFIASKVVFVGEGTQGWLIDSGRIYHSSGLIELGADGTIQTSNGKFQVTKEGAVKATDGEFAGRITASQTQIAGFKISGNGLTNDPFTNDAYIIFRNDSQGAFAGVGGNVLPASSGARAVARFENHDNNNMWGLGVNYGMLVSARNGGENRAIQIDGGTLTGLALKNTLIGPSETAKTLGRYDGHVICINTGECTITLPTMQLYDSGHVIKVKWLGAKVKFKADYCYTPNGNSYRYTRPCIIYDENDTLAPGNTLDDNTPGRSCEFIWVPELTRTIGNNTYYGAWIQYKYPRAW